MNDLFAIFFGFPSFIILAILTYVGIVGTIINIYIAVKIKDYTYLAFFFMVTICAASVGWIIGCFL
jgi:hypothetical protein